MITVKEKPSVGEFLGGQMVQGMERGREQRSTERALADLLKDSAMARTLSLMSPNMRAQVLPGIMEQRTNQNFWNNFRGGQPQGGQPQSGNQGQGYTNAIPTLGTSQQIFGENNWMQKPQSGQNQFMQQLLGGQQGPQSYDQRSGMQQGLPLQQGGQQGGMQQDGLDLASMPEGEFMGMLASAPKSLGQDLKSMRESALNRQAREDLKLQGIESAKTTKIEKTQDDLNAEGRDYLAKELLPTKKVATNALAKVRKAREYLKKFPDKFGVLGAAESLIPGTKANEMNALFEGLALDLLKFIPGASRGTQGIYNGVLRTKPGVNRSVAANKTLLRQLERALEQDSSRVDIYKDIKDKNGGKVPEDYLERLDTEVDNRIKTIPTDILKELGDPKKLPEGKIRTDSTTGDQYEVVKGNWERYY